LRVAKELKDSTRTLCR
jgi:IQ domain-containing protein G